MRMKKEEHYYYAMEAKGEIEEAWENPLPIDLTPTHGKKSQGIYR